LPHWSIGKLINNILETEIVFVVNGGPHPSGQAFGLGGLQRQQNTQILSKGVSS